VNILALDTSSTIGSIAIAKDNKICFSNLLDIKATHSERLMPQIDQGLQFSNLSIDELDLICLGNGPGSFTGIRIGLATAKGLCLGNEIPLLPFNTMEVVANNLFEPKYPVLVILDAKMNEIYAALYSSDMQILIPPQNADPEVFLQKINEKVIVSGDGIIKYRSLLEKLKIEYLSALPHHNILHSSTMIGLVLHKEITPEYDFELIADLEPYYLRKSQAELVRENKLKQEL